MPRTLPRKGTCGLLALGVIAPACGLEHLYSEADVVTPDASAPVDGSAPSEATPGPDAETPEAAAPGGCDTSKPWMPALPVPALNVINPSGGARLAPDELTVYFNAGSPPRVFTASRASRDGTFGAPVALPMEDGQDAGSDNLGSVAIAPDELSIYFERSGGGVAVIEYATRTAKDRPFGKRAIVPGLAEPGINAQPFLRGDGAELLFISRRTPAVSGNADVFRAKITAPGAATAIAHVAELGTPTDERAPAMSADGLTLYLGTERAPDGGVGSHFQIWRATRARTDEPWRGFAPVPELAAASSETPSWVSPDGCAMYLTSTRGGAGQIYVTRRPATGSSGAQAP